MPKELPRLGLDHDGVLGDLDGGFDPWLVEEYDHKLVPVLAHEIDRHHFDIEIAHGPPPKGEDSWDNPIHRYILEASVDTMQPMPGAVAAVGLLAVHYEIHVITSRPDYTEEVTRRWQEKHFDGLITKLHMPTGSGNPFETDKGKYCRSLGLTALVDDANHNVDSALAAGIRVISFGGYYYGYGAFDKDDLPIGAEKARNWEEVVEKLLPS